MDHDYLSRLKQTHPSLRLLAADNAPLIISFLYGQFVQSNRRSMAYSELVSRLDDYLFHLREIHGEGKYPKSARQYLDDWSDERSPFLRKYYPEQSDEPELDLTPATEKAIEWIQDLQTREFVGTESRLMTVFQLLREIVYRTEQDPQARIRELERRRAEIDEEIARIRVGRINSLDSTQVRERFYQAEDTARKLLADFRQVEYNFRDLDRRTREQIALSDQPKGELLDQIFSGHDRIRDSDQGRSFRAFWEFLMSPKRQAELDELLGAVYALEPVRDTEPGRLLHRIRHFLLEAGEKVYRSNNLLVEQLRKYLDDQAWLENNRIMELVRSIEKRAVAVKDQAPDQREFTTLDDFRPAVELVMSRSLFTPPAAAAIEQVDLRQGQAAVDVDALFQQTYIDPEELAANVRRLLQRHAQVSLAQVVRRFPVTRGLAELVAYLSLATGDAARASVDPGQDEVLEIRGEDLARKRVRLPKIVFVRG